MRKSVGKLRVASEAPAPRKERKTERPPAPPPAPPRALVLLGAQRFDPTLRSAMAELGVKGKVATITAGWQEREDDDADLCEHCDGGAVNLRLHARAERIFASDPVFHEAHRERQTLLRHRQDFYRIRLEHLLDAEQVLKNRLAPKPILEDEERASLAAIRDLDARHLTRCARDRSEFEDRWRPLDRPVVAKERAEIAELVADCEAVAIAGGHVASLLNRLALFGIQDLLADKLVFAWCAGAMALSERVVLFHDSPPQGQGAAEVLEPGLGLAAGVVVLPQPEFRLRLDDRSRMGLMASRFAPGMCLGLPARSWVTWTGGAPKDAHGVFELTEAGAHRPLGRALPPPRPGEPRSVERAPVSARSLAGMLSTPPSEGAR